MLQTLEETYQRRREKVKTHKKDQGLAMGYFCCNVPEEIVHAAGILPVRILGSLDPITEADAHLETIVCPFVRSCFDLALKGEYDFLSGIILPHSCDSVERIYPIWNHYIKPRFSHYVNLPHTAIPSAVEFYLSELIDLRQDLETFVERPISDADLANSIRVYNENRSLLRELYALRKGDPPLLSGAEALFAALAGTSMSKEQHNELLRQTIVEVQNRESRLQGRTRILLCGSEIDNVEFVQLIEDQGVNVVADDLCTGSRYFWDSVDEKKEPLAALADRYINKIPCPRTYPPEKRFEHIRQLAADYQVDGVILHTMKYCDPHLYDFPILRRRLEEAGLPLLQLEDDHSGAATGQLRTRIQAFVEMLGG